MIRKWEDKFFDVDIPPDEPIFALNVVCDLIEMQYWTIHQIIDEGIVEPTRRKDKKKLFSYSDVKKLKYVKYLMEEEGVNVQGVKIILELGD